MFLFSYQGPPLVTMAFFDHQGIPLPNLFVSLSKAWLPWTHKGFSFPVILLFTIVPYFSHQGLSLGHSGFSFKALLLVTKDQGSTPSFALF